MTEEEFKDLAGTPLEVWEVVDLKAEAAMRVKYREIDRQASQLADQYRKDKQMSPEAWVYILRLAARKILEAR